MKPRIRNVDSIAFKKWARGEKYEAEIGWAGAELGSGKLGFNLTVIPPGKAAFPHHAHLVNEEMFFILEGEGSLRIGDQRHKVRQGDLVSLPPGRDSAHQMINDSQAPLRYLAVSTMETPEVVEYPESGKLGIFTGSAPGRPAGQGAIRQYLYTRDAVGYWEGEE